MRQVCSGPWHERVAALIRVSLLNPLAVANESGQDAGNKAGHTEARLDTTEHMEHIDHPKEGENR